MEQALSDPEFGRHAGYAGARGGEPPRGCDHQCVRLGRTLRHRIGQKLQPPRGRRIRHELLKPRTMLPPYRPGTNLPVAQLRRQTQHRTGRARTQPDTR